MLDDQDANDLDAFYILRGVLINLTLFYIKLYIEIKALHFCSLEENCRERKMCV